MKESKDRGILIIVGICIFISSLIIAAKGRTTGTLGGELSQFLFKSHFITLFTFYGILIAQYYYPIKRTILSCVVYCLLFLSSYLIFGLVSPQYGSSVNESFSLPPSLVVLLPFWNLMIIIALIAIILRNLLFVSPGKEINTFLSKERKLSLTGFLAIISSPILAFFVSYYPFILIARIISFIII